MEKEKKRSVEEEAQLDIRIAMIRERNEQIIERQREIAEDRARAGGDNVVAQPKAEKTSTSSSPMGNKTKKGGGRNWDREWDHGKTPAEQWRENVPSMETMGKLAGQKGSSINRGGRGGHRGGRGGHHDGNRAHENTGPNVNGRLAGRVSFDKDDQSGKKSPSSGGHSGGRGSGSGGGHHQGRGGNRGARGGHKEHKDREVHVNGGDLKIGIKNVEHDDEETQEKRGQRRQNRKRGDNRQKRDGAEKQNDLEHNNNNEEQTHKSQNRPPRKESDSHSVKTILRILVDKVVKAERKEHRLTMEEENKDKEDVKEQKESNASAEKPTDDSNSKSENVETQALKQEEVIPVPSKVEVVPQDPVSEQEPSKEETPVASEEAPIAAPPAAEEAEAAAQNDSTTEEPKESVKDSTPPKAEIPTMETVLTLVPEPSIISVTQVTSA